MNTQLRDFYMPALDALRAAVPHGSGLSEPFLISIPDGYARAPVRLMVVGQETNGWGGELEGPTASVDELMALHAGFDLGRDYRSTPFWQAAHQLHSALNPDGPRAAFLWSNLVKVDFRGRRPSAEVEDAVSVLGLLPAEIAISRPDVIVFLTGPRYDGRLRKTFAGAELVDLGGGLVQVQHPALPAHSFRTYHPGYLRRSRRWDTLDRVATLAREA